MKINSAVASVKTHEGGKAVRVSPLAELKRTVMTCLLWENTFYEWGNDVTQRLAKLVATCNPQDVMDVAIEARSKQQLRHVPLFLLRELARRKDSGKFVEQGLFHCIQRADELSEFVALYWKDKKQPLSNPVKRGLAAAFTKFNEYQLAKYDRSNTVRLRDVLFMVHAKPRSAEQAELFKKLVDNKLESPDTWEVALSAGGNKKEVFERLLREKKLGGMAVIRNLRNMAQSNVNQGLVHERLLDGLNRVLPFRFITAARFVPQWEPMLEQAMLLSLKGFDPITGNTGLLIDVSGSMGHMLSAKSETTRLDAANGLAILLRELCPTIRVATFSSTTVEVPARRGFALRDVINKSQAHSSTHIRAACEWARHNWKDIDRFIVITDEQSDDGAAEATCPKSYVINVATYKYGVGDGRGFHQINGWSERVMDYIVAHERPEE